MEYNEISQKSLVKKMIDAANIIHEKSLKANANYMICSPAIVNHINGLFEDIINSIRENNGFFNYRKKIYNINESNIEIKGGLIFINEIKIDINEITLTTDSELLKEKLKRIKLLK